MNDSHVFALPDGRDLCWLETGDPTGPPVFIFHGTPGTRLQLANDDVSSSRGGARLISVDRPGYGFSSFHRGRRLVDWPSDVARLADHLGVANFAVLGVSGGGPHAAACGALLGDRLTGVALVSGVGPLARPLLRESLSRPMQLTATLATRRSRLLHAQLWVQSEVSRRWPAWAFNAAIKRLPAADVAILTRPSIRRLMELEAAHASRTVAQAQAQDIELFVADWGFDLGSITAPVHVWQGDADSVVPPIHATVLHEAIPGSQLHTVAGGGHFMAVDHLGEIVAGL